MLRELPPPSADHKTGHTKSLANPLPETSPNTQPLLFNMNIFTKINIYINIDIFTFTCKRRKTPRIGDLYSSSIQHLHFLQSDIHASICCLFFSLCIFHICLFSSPSSCPVCIKTHPLIYSASLSAFCHSESRRKEFRQKSQSKLCDLICGIVQQLYFMCE